MVDAGNIFIVTIPCYFFLIDMFLSKWFLNSQFVCLLAFYGRKKG